MNKNRTCIDSDTKLTRPRSGPVRYEVIDRDGNVHGPFHGIIQANAYAQEKWPDQEQDEDRTGKGWDVQVAGCSE